MKKIVLFWGICLIVFANCDHKKQTGADRSTKDSIRVNINLDEINKLELTPFTDSIQYLKLETTSDDNSLVSNIKKINFDQHRNIYIHDNQNKIFSFDKNGKFNYVIDKKGQGPGEYSTIENFSINENKNRIEILDLPKRQIACYDLSDGSFLEMRKLHQPVFSIFPIENNAFLADLPMAIDSSGNFGVFLLDSLFRKDRALLQYSGAYPLLNQDFGVFSELNNNEYGIYSHVENAIYHFTADNLTKRYIFNFENRTPVQSLHGQDLWSMSESEQERIATVIFYKETNTLILLRISDKGALKIFLYDKKENHGQVISPIDKSHFFMPSYIKTDTKNNMITAITTDIILMINEHNENNKNGLRPDLYELMRDTKEEDNPILQIIHLK